MLNQWRDLLLNWTPTKFVKIGVRYPYFSCNYGWLVVFYVPSTARSFRGLVNIIKPRIGAGTWPNKTRLVVSFTFAAKPGRKS